ncbi:MAG: hypothetical protein NTW49_13190 [Bacteroidia bacterium]|nr:hypothetical protein [Bacteroidia bacterium]
MSINILKIKTKRNLLRICFFVALLTIGLSAFSQPIPGNPGNGGGPGLNDDVGGGAPLDGGLSILLLLGTAFGGRKLFYAFRSEERQGERSERSDGKPI